MMFRSLALSCLLIPAVLCAAEPVGKVRSTKAFKLSGVHVPVAGIPNWPVVAGDVVELSSSPGMLQLVDGSRLYFDANSRFELREQGGATAVLLSQGALWYERSLNSQVKIAGGTNDPLPQGSREGRLSVSGETANWSDGRGTPSVVSVLGNGNGNNGNGNGPPDKWVPKPDHTPHISKWQPGTKPPHAPGPPGGTPPGRGGTPPPPGHGGTPPGQANK